MSVLLAGDPGRHADFESAVASLESGGPGVEWLRPRAERRRVARSSLPDGTPCLVKHYLAPRRHRLREAAKRALGLGSARREWRALERLAGAGVRVPRPLAHLRLADGEEALLMEWVEARPLLDLCGAPPRERRRLLNAAGQLVRSLHSAGWVHRDLNAGNLLMADGAPALVDVAAVRRKRSPRARHSDLGDLDQSLAGLLSLADRLRLRAACLGLAPPFDASGRGALRAVGRAARARRGRHLRSRARRSLRPGRRARRLRLDGASGLIAAAADPELAKAALAGERLPPGVELRRADGRWPDLWRGSAARRGWHGAHALAAAGLLHPLPLACLEWRRWGRPRASALLVELPAEAPDTTLAERIEAWARLWARLHDAGFETPVPDARALRFVPAAGGLEALPSAPEQLVLGRNLPSPDGKPLELDALESAWRGLGADAGSCQRGRAAYRQTLRCPTARPAPNSR